MRFLNRLLLFYCLFFSSVNGLAQEDTITQYLVIDTIIDNRTMPIHDKNSPIITLYYFGNFFESDSNWSIHNSYPCLQTKFRYTIGKRISEGVSATIVFDDFAGEMGLFRLKKYGDTIHISRWTLYHNCTHDTLLTDVETLEYINDSLVGTQFDNNNVDLRKILLDSCKSIPDSIFIKLNGNNYVADVEHRLALEDHTYSIKYPRKKDKKMEALYRRAIIGKTQTKKLFRYSKQKIHVSKFKPMYAVVLLDEEMIDSFKSK